jgi:hypothetical protein
MLPLQLAAIQDEVGRDVRELVIHFPWYVMLAVVLAVAALLVFISRNRTKA